jgi:hypothetical protein
MRQSTEDVIGTIERILLVVLLMTVIILLAGLLATFLVLDPTVQM